MTVRLATQKNMGKVLLTLRREHPDLHVAWVTMAEDGRIAVAVAASEREAKREIAAALKAEKP
jgi:hypothetical protein